MQSDDTHMRNTLQNESELTHVLELLRRILQTIRVGLQDAHRGDARVEPTLYGLADLPHHPLLVADVRAQVALAREPLEPHGVIPDDGLLLPRLLREVDGTCTGLNEGERHPESEPTVAAGDERNAIGQREPVHEERGVRGCRDCSTERVWEFSSVWRRENGGPKGW